MTSYNLGTKLARTRLAFTGHRIQCVCVCVCVCVCAPPSGRGEGGGLQLFDALLLFVCMVLFYFQKKNSREFDALLFRV